jgi:ATP-binding protein involved in chromosome partitioning
MGTIPSEKQVLDALSRVQDPDLGKDIVSLGFVKDLLIRENLVSFTLELTTPACPMKELMTLQAKDILMGVPGVKNVEVRTTAKVAQSAPLRDGIHKKDLLLSGVRNIIAVASGKGGVGKSTVTANLAVALASTGARVGLMDADFFGPSITVLLGADTPPEALSETRLRPAEKFGVKLISMAYFLPRDKAVIWRGPMLHRMVRQFLENVEWGELDYLLIDLPPGTGDVQLSLCQTVSLTGAVIVSTPQDLALTVASKAISMFQELQTPILGIIENMSYYVCPHCGNRDEIFGHGGARQASAQLGYSFLGAIPLSAQIRERSDQGRPLALREETSELASPYREAAQKLASQVSIHEYRNRLTTT